MPPKKIKDVDRGWKRITELSKFKDLVASVGVQGKEANEDHGGVTNVLVASVHEFGSSKRNIPSRSFMRSTYDENIKKYQKEIDALGGKMIDGIQAKGELRIIGELYRGDIIKKIQSNIPPKLADATILRKKGEATALIGDTGQLFNSFRVVVKNAKDVQR